MQIRKLLVALLACLSVPATADFVTVIKAHEVELDDLRLPQSINGTLSFKACDDCEYQTVRVTAATVYEANGRNYTLDDYREALESVSNPRDEHITVMQHLESGTITAVHASY